MTKAAIDRRPAPEAKQPGASQPKKQKQPAFLVTSDVDLWPQVATQLSQKLIYRQIDSVDELLRTAPPDQPGVVLWDARECAHREAVLAQLQEHSARFAIVTLDQQGGDAEWESAVRHGQIVAFVPLPIDAELLSSALISAYEEASARVALLGDVAALSAAPPPGHAAGAARRGSPRYAPLGLAGAVIVCLATLVYYLHDNGARRVPAPRPSAPGASSTPAAGAPADPATEEKVDALIEQAQRAMRDRHFIDPADGSALVLYRNALVLDPSSGEARQGLSRLGEILLTHVQSALDERQFDAALQALETARSINPEDTRLPALDERIAKMRAEFGPAEILAAINAQNFDRAVQLIDSAARAKSLSEQKLGQLREQLKQRRAESDAAGLAARTAIEQHRVADADKLASGLKGAGAPVSVVEGVHRETGLARAEQGRQQTEQPPFLDLARSRLAQGSVIEPQNDNALYYLNQLRADDPQNGELPQLSKSIQAQILEQARAALDGGQSAEAATLLQLAGGLGPSSELDALNERLRIAKLFLASGPKEVSEAALTRTRKLEIVYPRDALERRIEGAVEIGYTVTAKGVVSDIKVLDSNPSGIFEKAATDAVSRVRYKAVLEDGKAVAVTTKMLVKFRLATELEK